MTKEIIEILENIMYWETCPDDYKEKIKSYLASKPFINFTKEVIRYYEEYDIGDYDLYKKAKELISANSLN